MKALLINPKFPFSFWSLPKANRLNGAKFSMYPLGLITMAALLPDKWELRLVDQNTGKLTEEDWAWADVAMISAMYVQKEGLLDLIREAKQRSKTTVSGGPYPTSMPHDVLAAGCDLVFCGEAENAISKLLFALEKEKPRGIIENNVKPEMSESPVPRFDLLHLNDYSNMSIQTSRGCPFDCEFCDVVNLYGRKPRYKRPGQVIKELDFLYRLGARRHLFINDDNFIGDKTHAQAILHKMISWNKYRGEPFGFSTQVSINLGQDIEMIDLMTRANFGEVIIGIETPDEDVLAINRKYQNIRHPMLESLNTINKNGLSVVPSFVLGFDEEKKGSGDHICALVEKANTPMVVLNTLQVLPNTKLWHRIKKEGRLLEDMTSGNPTGAKLNYVPTRPESEIMEEYTKAWEYLFEPSRYLRRAYNYCLDIRPTRRAIAKARGEALPPGPPKSKLPLRTWFYEIIAVFLILWWQGICSSYRRQFWRQLFGIRRQNPSRLKKYFIKCAAGEDMFYLREEFIKNTTRAGKK